MQTLESAFHDHGINLLFAYQKSKLAGRTIVFAAQEEKISRVECR